MNKPKPTKEKIEFLISGLLSMRFGSGTPNSPEDLQVKLAIKEIMNVIDKNTTLNSELNINKPIEKLETEFYDTFELLKHLKIKNKEIENKFTGETNHDLYEIWQFIKDNFTPNSEVEGINKKYYNEMFRTFKLWMRGQKIKSEYYQAFLIIIREFLKELS